jgi:hypothetical protein
MPSPEARQFLYQFPRLRIRGAIHPLSYTSFRACKERNLYRFKVCKSVHHHIFKYITSYIQINQPTRCINLSASLPVIYVQLNMFRAFLPIIRSLSTAVAASGLPLDRGGSSVVGRDRSVCVLSCI